MYRTAHLQICRLEGCQPGSAVPVRSLVQECFQLRQARRRRGGHLEGADQLQLVCGIAVSAPATQRSACYTCSGMSCQGFMEIMPSIASRSMTSADPDLQMNAAHCPVHRAGYCVLPTVLIDTHRVP